MEDNIRKLREVLHKSVISKQHIWNQRDDGRWNKLWASFDNISDAQIAINDAKRLDKMTYLSFYGVMQALIIQQDTLKHIEESLGVSLPKFHPILQNIRSIRNETAGHPSETGRKNEPKTYTTIRRDIRNKTIEYYVSGNKNETKSININEAIRLQEEVLKNEIKRIISEINKKEEKHMENFKN